MTWKPAVAVLGLLVVGLLAVALFTGGQALGQNQQPPAQPQWGQQGPGGPGQPGMGGMRPMMGMMQPPTPAIAVDRGKIYVVLGPTLYRFDGDTLSLERQTTFIEKPRPMGPGGGMMRQGQTQ